MSSTRNTLRICTLIAGLAFPASQALSDAFPDDHGDSIADGATSVAVDAVTGGSVEVDIDRDHFSFLAEPGFQYRIRVNPGTLWDADVKLRAFDGAGGVLVDTNSVGATEADFSYPHVLGPTTVYVDVGGFAKFTLGTYTITISRSGIEDSEPDGLPDSWENEHFNTLANLPGEDEDIDGFTNLEELLLGTDPTDPGSGLWITAILPVSAPGQEITWSSALLRQYELSGSSTLTGGTWNPVATVPAAGPTTTFTDPNAGGPDHRFYRVRTAN